jgi:hypothetical protein
MRIPDFQIESYMKCLQLEIAFQPSTLYSDFEKN